MPYTANRCAPAPSPPCHSSSQHLEGPRPDYCPGPCFHYIAIARTFSFVVTYAVYALLCYASFLLLSLRMLSVLCYACVSFFPSSLRMRFGLSVVTWSASAILCFRVVAKRSAEGVMSGLRSGHDEVGKGGMGITGGCTSLSGDSSPHNILSTYLAYLHTSLSGITRQVPGSRITCTGDHRVIQQCGEVIRNRLRRTQNTSYGTTKDRRSHQKPLRVTAVPTDGRAGQNGRSPCISMVVTGRTQDFRA